MLTLVTILAVTVTFSPAKPTVGDPIVVQFDAPVVLDASQEYEVVSRQGRRVMVRTFTPKPIVLSGSSNGVRFRNLVIPVRSVLKPNDDLKPAPLAAPRAIPYPRAPFIAIAIAALLAIAAWVLAWRLARRPAREAVPLLSPDERFRRAVLSLREGGDPRRWAALADETRLYLATTRPHLGSELTTTELMPRLRDEERVVVDILRQGDLEKFAPFGPEPIDFDIDFDMVASRALELAS